MSDETEDKKNKSNKDRFKEFMSYFLIFLAVILIRTFIITPVKVSGTSMYKTLDGGETMLLNKLGKLDRYDMVVADITLEDKKDDTIIKRIYGLPNETIKCEKGIIYINDKKIEDKYGYGKTTDFEEVKLNDNEYFLLGDNREISLDSRYIGAVKKDDIEGTTSIILWPLSKFGKVKYNN